VAGEVICRGNISASELDLLLSEHFETHGRLVVDGTLVSSVMGFDPFLSAGECWRPTPPL
jgi:hypothetical protein